MNPQPTHSTPTARIGCYTQVNPNDIVRLEAERNYTRIYQSNGKDFLVARTLKLVEEDLEEHAPLLRLNRKDVINLKYAQEFSQAGIIVMANRSVLSVSRRRFKITMDLLRRHFNYY
ncbi:LytTR family DNA-binding domain-containing protein [Telluribacter sp. SYSU D00476]|uniref:LytTR family DNA-binding domain-containing protein n=1 Tax=Telluribacter sp. SYSU D00476 TaxID=2811430 RepID=UPI001FF38ECB|nr:LytTR family DNA-binding domain-containing protein [Telluribacter sp. SYSU D00476]